MVFRRRRRNRQNRFTYSAWDGTQAEYAMTAEDLFSQMTDDLAYHGDPNAALRKLLQDGYDLNGERMQGLRDMLQRLKERREEMLAQGDLGDMFGDITERLNDIIAAERENLAAQAEYSAGGDDPSKAAQDAQSAAERNMRLDMLPPDLPGQIRTLDNYDFTSKKAQEDYDELVGDLRNQLMQQAVDGMSDAMSNMSPEDLAAMKDMMADLNEMLDQRANGVEPDFDAFMDKHGDFFPENPENLDELLEAMAARMAAAQAMLNSMSPEQRAQLQELSNQLLGDVDLQFQMNQLSNNLQGLFPDMNWGDSYQTQGVDPLGFGQAIDLMSDLGDLDQIEQLLRNTSNPGALAELDFDRAAELLGEGHRELDGTARRVREDARRGRDDQHQRGRDGTHPSWAAPGWPKCSRRPLLQVESRSDRAPQRVGVGHWA